MIKRLNTSQNKQKYIQQNNKIENLLIKYLINYINKKNYIKLLNLHYSHFLFFTYKKRLIIKKKELYYDKY